MKCLFAGDSIRTTTATPSSDGFLFFIFRREIRLVKNRNFVSGPDLDVRIQRRDERAQETSVVSEFFACPREENGSHYSRATDSRFHILLPRRRYAFTTDNQIVFVGTPAELLYFLYYYAVAALKKRIRSPK